MIFVGVAHRAARETRIAPLLRDARRNKSGVGVNCGTLSARPLLFPGRCIDFMVWLDFGAGVLVAALAGLGVGGGGLLVIYLTMFKGIGQVEAQGLNLLFFVAAGAASLLIHVKKRKLDYKKITLIIACGAAGAVAGSLLANIIDCTLVKKIFGGFLIASGVLEFFWKK